MEYQVTGAKYMGKKDHPLIICQTRTEPTRIYMIDPAYVPMAGHFKDCTCEECTMVSPPPMDERRCTCGNSAMVTALGELMANHWGSEPITSQRQSQIIEALSSAVVLLGADIVDGKVKIQLPLTGGYANRAGITKDQHTPATYFSSPALSRSHPPKWEPGEEKMMAVCTGCYRHLMELPTQLPPEQYDIEETTFEQVIPPRPFSALARDIFLYARRAVRHLRRPPPTPTSAP